MASGETPSPMKGPKLSVSSSSSRNDCDEVQWMLLPNNLEISARSKLSKKQRNKEKLKNPQDVVLPNTSEIPIGNPITFQNFSRSKCNTASWLHDQYSGDEKSRNKTSDPEEVFTDANLSVSHGASLNFPLGTGTDVLEYNEDSQRPSSRRSLVESESAKSVKEGYKKNEGSSFRGEEDHANKYNHLFEKMKQSEERLMSLEMQESLLYNLQKKAENKFYQGVNVRTQEASVIEPERIFHEQPPEDQPRAPTFWNAENGGEHRKWLTDKPIQSHLLNESEKHLCSWKEPQDIKQLHISLERIRKRVQSIQQSPDLKNVTTALSTDDYEIGERVAAVEFERKKLKNKLVELQEKKKMNDELLQELSYLKETAHTALQNGSKKDENLVFIPPTRVYESTNSKDKNRDETSLADADRKLYKLQSTLKHLEELIKSLSTDESAHNGSSTNDSSDGPLTKMDSRNVRPGSCVKRDNVKKEVNSGFPARRHYEAEGRANEDSDVPTTTQVVNQPSASANLSLESQEKIKKLQSAEKQMKIIEDIMSSIREAEKSGTPLGLKHLELFSTLDTYEKFEPDKDSSSDSEESDFDPRSTEQKPPEALNVKEAYSEKEKIALQRAERELVESQKHVKLMKDVLTSLQEFEKSGKPIPHNHLRVLVDLRSAPNISESDSVSEAESDVIVQDNKENQSNQSQLPSSTLHEIGEDEINGESSVAGAYSADLVSIDKKDVLSFVNEYTQHIRRLKEEINKRTSARKTCFSLPRQLNSMQTSDVKIRHEDAIRSSGEGGYVPNRTIENCRNLPEQVQPVRPLCHHPDNLLLTRQNVATMESQARRNVQNKGRNEDNINNLSGKIQKNTMHVPFSQLLDSSKDNLDSISMFSSELNQCPTGETETQAILSFIKKSKKKQMYNRNHDNHIRSNSSINSDPLEDTTSVAAADTTVAATWGGSSTQENFDDENDELPSRLHVQYSDGVNGRNYNTVPKLRSSKRVPIKEDVSVIRSNVPMVTSCSSESSKNYPKRISTHFLQQLKAQIGQLNALCQEELSDGSQTNFPQSLNQNFSYPCQHLQAPPDVMTPSNQQLLLCLSQCYHTLYLQQLEIQNLQRYIRENVDSGSTHQSNISSDQGNNEEFEFRPWCLPNTTPVLPSNICHNDRIPSRPAPYAPLQLKTYSTHNTPVVGTRPIQAIIHPASQDNRVSQGMLNNQVPPRTRANNFLDNFRSYSRQNLLSTSSNVKRNENIGLHVAPQVRQVLPMVSNENTNSSQENLYNTRVPQELERNDHRNSSVEDSINRSKRPNSGHWVWQKKESFVNTNSTDVRNPGCEQLHTQAAGNTIDIHSSNSSVNLIQLNPVQDDSKLVNLSPICPTLSDSTAPPSTSSMHSVLPSEFDCHSDFLIGLYRETKALKSDLQRRKALKLIRDLAKSEKSGSEPMSQNKVRNDHSHTASNKVDFSAAVASTELTESCLETTGNAAEGSDSEKPSTRLSDSTSWINQNLPTAAISPLSKQSVSRSVSTGAVRKKPKFQGASFSNGSSSLQEPVTSARDEDCDRYSPLPEEPFRVNADFPESIVENIMLDLQSAVPFGQMQEDSSYGFWSSINAYIINRIRAHMQVPLSHKSLAPLRQSLDYLIPVFSGIKFCDCEADFFKYISTLLYDSVTSFLSTGRFRVFPPNGSLNAECGEKTQELFVKMPSEPDKIQDLNLNGTGDTLIPILQQNILSTAEQTNNSEEIVASLGLVATEVDVGCDWGLDAEAEPEVGTEADLAEADQSPGQGKVSSVSLPCGDSWSVDQSNTVYRNGSASNFMSTMSANEELAETVEDDVQIASTLGACEEAALDDVPIKLSSTEEEPEKLEEPVSHITSKDDIKEDSEIVLESNNCEVEKNS